MRCSIIEIRSFIVHNARVVQTSEESDSVLGFRIWSSDFQLYPQDQLTWFRLFKRSAQAPLVYTVGIPSMWFLDLIPVDPRFVHFLILVEGQCMTSDQPILLNATLFIIVPARLPLSSCRNLFVNHHLWVIDELDAHSSCPSLWLTNMRTSIVCLVNVVIHEI